MVYIHDRELVVTPKFPFTLMFLPEIYGLDIRVPLTSVTSATPATVLMRRILRITFAAGGPSPMELSLRDEESFIRHLGSVSTTNDKSPPLPPQKPPRRYRRVFLRIFMTIWGTVALAEAFSGLPDDYRYRRDGIETTGQFDSHTGTTGDRNDAGILSYSVGGQQYHLVSLRGSGVYKIGGTAKLFYIPGKPEDAREADYLLFDLSWLGLGTLALTFSIFGGVLLRRLGWAGFNK
jgi:hypothetical protein